MKITPSGGMLALLALACLVAFPRSAHSQQTLAVPLVLTCPTATPGASVAPWVNCASGSYGYRSATPDAIVATDSTSTGTWQRFKDIAATRLVRACPKGATISADLKSCVNAAGTASAMTFLSRAIIEQGNPIGTGTARLSWAAPTANTDGTPLTDLAGFTIFAGLASPPQQTVAKVGAGVLSYTVENLAPGQWYFGVKARNAAGVESDFSGIATKTIENIVPPTLTFSVSPADGVERVTPRIVWSTSNATLCSASGAWSGTRATAGDELLPPITQSATYQLVCTGQGGEARATAFVAVSARPAAPASFKVE